MASFQTESFALGALPPSVQVWLLHSTMVGGSAHPRSNLRGFRRELTPTSTGKLLLRASPSREKKSRTISSNFAPFEGLSAFPICAMKLPNACRLAANSSLTQFLLKFSFFGSSLLPIFRTALQIPDRNVRC